MQSYDDLSRFMVFGIQPVERVQALPALLRVSPLYDASRFRRRQRRRAMPIPLSIIYERSLSVKEENKNIVLSFRVTPEEKVWIEEHSYRCLADRDQKSGE